MTGDEHTLELGGAVEAEAIHESQPGQRGQAPGQTAEWAARLTGAPLPVGTDRGSKAGSCGRQAGERFLEHTLWKRLPRCLL